MPEENAPVVPDEGKKSLKEVFGDMFSNIKTPIFWFAIGYGLCKFMDRKRT